MNKDQIMEAIEAMSVLELSELVKALEEKFGVTAAAPMMMAGAPAAAAAPVEEKTEFTVILKDSGANKIGAIKAVRTLKPELGLGEAKAFVEKLPATIIENGKKEDADNAKKVLEEAGCVVEVK